jgi:hypothetical protein
MASIILLSALLAGVPVSGLVIDAESRNPIAGAHVVLIPERNWTGPPGSHEAITDQNGRFVLESVSPGRYRVHATHPRYASMVEDDMPEIEIAEGRAFAGVEISLAKGAAITGRLVDARGEPQAAVMVSALRQSIDPATNRMGAITAAMTQTNDLGEFRLASLHEGSYTVIAMPAPPQPFGLPASRSGGQVLAPTFYPGTTDKDAAEVITVATAQTVTGLQFSMVAVPAYQVSGVVVDEADAPLSGSMVMLMLESRDGGGGPPLVGRSGENGVFHIDGVVPGSYRMVASTPMMQAAQDGTVIGAGGGGAGGFVAVGGVFVGGSHLGGPGAGPGATMPAPIEVTVANGDVSGVKIVVARR